MGASNRELLDGIFGRVSIRKLLVIAGLSSMVAGTSLNTEDGTISVETGNTFNIVAVDEGDAENNFNREGLEAGSEMEGSVAIM